MAAVTIGLSQADAAAIVLQGSGRAMHRREIADEILRRGFHVWASDGPGRTPWESVGRAITQEIVQLGADARFEYERKGSGTYRLRGQSSPQAPSDSLTPTFTTSVISLELDEVTAAQVDMERGLRGISREEFILRALKRQLWELDIKRAEEQWAQSYRDQPVDLDELKLWDSVRADPGPWEPRS